MTITLATLALITAIVSAAAAWGSWRAALRANQTAERLARIEQDRRHEEMTPKFRFRFALNEPNAAGAYLGVEMIAGPSHLDSVVITILDETGQLHWDSTLPDGVTQDQARRFVWGPWKFNTGASAQVADERTTKPRPYSLVDGTGWDRLHLVRTEPGSWMAGTTSESWSSEHCGPLRLRTECELDGYRPWQAVYDVDWHNLPTR